MIKQNSMRCLVAVASLLLSACATKPIIPAPLLKPMAERHPEELSQSLVSHGEGSNGMKLSTSIQDLPRIPVGKLSTVKPTGQQPAVPEAKAEEANITVAFDQLPLPQFIQAVYGLILKKSYSVDPQVEARKDLITLHAAQLQTPSQIERTAKLLLKTYGVAVADMGAGNYRIIPDNSQTGYAPEIMRGRAMPEVPLPLRPVYQMVELKAVRTGEVIGWLNKLFGNKVSIVDDASHNTLVLSGQPDDVSAVLETLDLLDQPSMAGRKSLRINPVNLTAEELSAKLNYMLTAEGYSSANSPSAAYPINLIPVQGLNTIIVFATDPVVMSHIIDWAKELDKPAALLKSGGEYLTYKARYTNAAKLASTIESLIGRPPTPPPTYAPGQAPIGVPPPAAKPGTRVIVDPATNMIIIQGNVENQQQLLNLLQELDKPPKSALIEVTVAEVTLNEGDQLGVEWALNAAAAAAANTVGGAALAAGAPAAVTMGSGGIALGYLNRRGDVRAVLNLLATSSNANVLSSPRIVARNGEPASIQVGSQIPTISSQQTNAATGGTGVLQSVQYLNTGVILNITPFIYAGDRVDLDVTQEVSGSTSVGVAGSPIVDTRKISTHLSLKDGMPVLIGGLISQNNSHAETGVPLLKDIPLFGRAFRKDNDNKQKTELLMLITPYIISDDHDAQEITEAFRNQLGAWARSDVKPEKDFEKPSGRSQEKLPQEKADNTPVTPEKAAPPLTPPPAPAPASTPAPAPAPAPVPSK